MVDTAMAVEREPCARDGVERACRGVFDGMPSFVTAVEGTAASALNAIAGDRDCPTRNDAVRWEVARGGRREKSCQIPILTKRYRRAAPKLECHRRPNRWQALLSQGPWRAEPPHASDSNNSARRRGTLSRPTRNKLRRRFL